MSQSLGDFMYIKELNNAEFNLFTDSYPQFKSYSQ